MNAEPLISVTELGIVIDVNADVFWNDWKPILVTEFGIKTEFKFVADLNALSPILVTSVPISTALISVATHPDG